MSKNLELAIDYFERHALGEECHITSDGRVFHNSGSAQGFAGTLTDHEVEKFTRAQIEKLNEPVIDDLKSFEEVVLDLNSFDPKTSSYEDAKALVKDLGLETKSNKKEDLFAAIQAVQNKTQE